MAQKNIENVYIEICNQCNLKCLHCYNESTINNHQYIEINQFIAIVNQMLNAGIRHITLSGGEPLLHPNIDKILSFLNDNKEIETVRIVTNGTLLVEKLSEYISSMPKLLIQISLDGGTYSINDKIRGVGTYNKVEEALIYLSQRGFSDVTLRLTINAVNYCSIEDFIHLSIKYNATPTFSFINKLGRGDTNWENLALSEPQKLYIRNIIQNSFTRNKIPFLKEHILPPSVFCPIEQREPIISPIIKVNGDVQPCHVLYDEIFSIGNVFQNELNSILSYEKNVKLDDIANFFSIRKRMIKSHGSCLNCTVCDLCGGGCPAEAFVNNADILSNDGQCQRRFLSLASMALTENR